MQRQTRLVAGHLMRVAASAAELGRTMQYLSSAMADDNMQFLHMLPAYIARDEDGKL